MHCRMLADMSWLSCVSRCFLASIFPTRATVLCIAAQSKGVHRGSDSSTQMLRRGEHVLFSGSYRPPMASWTNVPFSRSL